MTFWGRQIWRRATVVGWTVWTVWAAGCVGSETVLEILPPAFDGTDSSIAGFDETENEMTAGDSEPGMPEFDTDVDGCGSVEWESAEYDITSARHVLAMDGVTHFRGDLVIMNFDASEEDMAPLKSLRCVDGGLYIRNIGGLSSLSPFSNLIAVGGDLVIQSNNHLKNVDDLKRLRAVGGELVLYNNDALGRLDGVQGISSLGGENLYILYNAVLPTCEAMEVYNGVSEQGWRGEACIFENSDDGCGNIREACSGKYYWHP